MERTLTIIKPDAFQAKNVGKIIAAFEANGFKVVGLKLTRLTKRQAEQFYAVHSHRPFFGEMTQFMTSAPVVVLCLEAEDAVKSLRALMGPTNPADAPAGTLRKDFGSDIQCNAVHGSDSLENANNEIAFFFSNLELHE